jgi:hypothetical protein
VYGWREFGIWGALLGIPTGAILGPLVFYVAPITVILALCSVVVFKNEGWHGVKIFWCGEGTNKQSRG